MRSAARNCRHQQKLLGYSLDKLGPRGRSMQTKDYLTLILSSLALVVSVYAAWLSRSSFGLARSAFKRLQEFDVVEAVTRKNTILKEYEGLMKLIEEVRFYC